MKSSKTFTSNHLIPSMISVLYSYILSIKCYTVTTNISKIGYEYEVVVFVTVSSFIVGKFYAFQENHREMTQLSYGF